MRISVKARPASKKDEVRRIDEGRYVVEVREPPVQGRANAAIVKTLAAFLHIAPSRVQIISGHFSREKIIEISD